MFCLQSRLLTKYDHYHIYFSPTITNTYPLVKLPKGSTIDFYILTYSATTHCKKLWTQRVSTYQRGYREVVRYEYFVVTIPV